MWTFGKSKKQREAEEIEEVLDELAHLIKETECKEKEPNLVPVLSLYFTDGRKIDIEYGSVTKRNKEAAELRAAIHVKDWCSFQTQNNREVYVDSRELTMVIENDQKRHE